MLSVALIAAIAAMATPAWYVYSETESDGSSYQLQVGLKTFSKVSTSADGSTVTTTTGKLSDWPSGDSFYSFAMRLDGAGNYILETGVPALVLLVGSAVLYCCYNSRKCGAMGLFGSIAMGIAAAVLIVLGMLLYSHKLYVGYSFMIYLLGALLFLTSTVLLISSYFGEEPSKTKQGCGLFGTLAAVTIVSLALGTVAWVVFTSSDDTGSYYELDIGVKAYKQISTLSDGTTVIVTTGLLSDLQNSSRYITAGNYALGFGVCGAVFGFVGAILVMLELAGKKGKFVAVGILFDLIAAILIIIGDVLYAKKLNVGYSFIVWTASAFIVLASVALLVSGVFVSTETEGAGARYKLSTSPTTETEGHTRLHDAT